MLGETSDGARFEMLCTRLKIFFYIEIWFLHSYRDHNRFWSTHWFFQWKLHDAVD